MIECAGDYLGAGLLGDRHGFAGHQGLIESRSAFEDDPVHRYLFSRPDAQFVADLQAIDRNLMVGAILVDNTGGFRRQLEQRLDRSGRRLAGAEFEDLAKQDEDGDNSGGLEVDRNRAVIPAKSRRKNIGQEGTDQAVDIGHARAHRDQGEHIEIAAHQRLPAAHEKRPPRPQHDRGSKHQLNPVRQGLVNPAVTAGKMTAHLQDDRRKGKHKADPEAPRHVREFGIWRRVQRCHFGLQRHAADRAVSGTDLADLRMHRAGVDRAFRRGGVRLSGVMVMATITGVIVTAAAAGILCSAYIRVFGFGHRTLRHGPLATHTL